MTAFLVGVEILAPLALVFFGGYRDEPHPIVLVVGTACALPFVWGFAETYHDYARMKRRVVLGLCDPVVGNRFALATIWNGALLVLPIALVPLRS
ncbi:MAG: hypothetical protein GY910_24920 [bacterium]|nr:hypothetical protein [bacterium]